MSQSPELIRQALKDVIVLMERAFAEVAPAPVPDSALHQAGLADGASIVEDYLRHNEAGLALEHLIYMVHEPDLPISVSTFDLIERAARGIDIDLHLVESIRP